MISIKDAVIHRPTFEKVGEFELNKDTSQWGEEILKQFYEQVDYLPKDIGTDVSIKSVDDNEGYAKGSVVAWFHDKKINFPIIVKKYVLSPFDVFVTYVNGKPVYMPANAPNIKLALSSDRMATLENIWAAQSQLMDYKTPGGVTPKTSIPLFDVPEDQIYNPYAKLASAWHGTAAKEDLEKLALQLKSNVDVAQSFIDNTGDLITNIVDLQNGNKQTTADQSKSGVIDTNKVINAKRLVTVLDSEIIDPSKFQPASPPGVYELRLYEFPSVEQFMESGDVATRFLSTKIGQPVVGVLLDCLDGDDLNQRYGNDVPVCCGTSSTDPNNNIIRERRKQIFISACGKCYSTYNDYDKTGIGYYASGSMPNAVAATIKLIESRTSSEFVNNNKDNRFDGSDKLFNPIQTLEQGKKSNDNYYGTSWLYNRRLLIVYGSGENWEAAHLSGNYRKFMINNTSVYVSQDMAFIPARIGSIQKVQKVEDPIYKMAMGGVKNIYLYPETAIIINTDNMTELQCDDFLRPSIDIRAKFEKEAKNVTYIKVASENGFSITGDAIKPLQKIANFNDNKIYTPKEVVAALSIMGMDKTAAHNAIKLAFDRFMSSSGRKDVAIFGLTDQYVNPNVFDGVEKTARVNNLRKQIASGLRIDLVKEASVINDPEAVDVVLSLNFINQDNLDDFIDNIGVLKRVASKLAELLVSVRMGLSDVDESAVKKSMEGLETVIEGLENVKTAIKK